MLVRTVETKLVKGLVLVQAVGKVATVGGKLPTVPKLFVNLTSKLFPFMGTAEKE